MDSAQPARGNGNLLVVDDDLTARQTMEAFLTRNGYEVSLAPNGETALMFAREDPPELILLDIRLPDMDGFQVCRLLKGDQKTRDIPVIFISGLDDVVDKIKGFAAGGVDYITKPFQAGEMLARMETHLTLRRLQKKVEAQNAQLEQEITMRKQAQEALQRAHGVLEERVKERTVDLAVANEQLSASAKALEERLEFESLLSEISARFINLPADQIDSEIESAQRRICELLDLDRSTLFQVPEREPGTLLLLTHVHQPPGSPPPPGRVDAKDLYPWATQKILAGETVIISKMTDLPPEAGRDRESFRWFGTQSGVYVPLSVGEEPVFGLLGFAVKREERSWSETVVMGFKLIAQVFANVLARKRAEQALRETESRLSIATRAAGAGLWIMESDTGHVWVTPRTRELFLFAPDEELNYESFFKVIHPEDRDRVHQAAQQALRSGENLYCDYRIVLPDGNIRWIVTRGQRYLRTTGVSDRLMGVSLDITERKQAEEALEDRLRFERLLSDLSSRFVNISTDRVDSEIETGLRQILEFFQVDRCVLFRTLPDRTSWQITQTVTSNDAPHLPPGVKLSKSIYPWAYEKLSEKHEVMSVSRLDDLPAEASADRQSCIKWGIRSYLNIPILVGESVDIIHISSGKSERVWPEELIPRLRLLGEIFVNALERKQNKLQLEERFQEIENLKQRLERENIYLREEVNLLVKHGEIVGQSVAMKKVLTQAEQVAKTDSTVLLLGETGTGKELLARAIHSMSLRKDRPLVTVNCASLPPTLIESELFGREQGAYTGAMTKMIGRFEIADGSTLFLDEIGEIPLDLQSKLLRVLEEGSFERLGSTKPLHANVRVIAATNRDIEHEVKEGKFRRDLFYRLNVFPIMIPPLREHPEDIPLLVRAVVKEFQKRMGKEIESIPKKTMQALQSYSWPGNVRELRNLIEHAMILSEDKTLDVHMPNLESSKTEAPREAPRGLEDLERRHIVSVLEKTGWRIGGQGAAADVLGLKRTTLISKMKKLGIRRPNKPMSK
jgi:PAS domain S-box-containing protein